MSDTYIGTELEIFAHASNWKQYFSSLLPPFGEKVLEVGTGMGATASILCDGTQTEWLCLEPDPQFFAQVDSQIRSGALPPCCRTKCGTIQDLAAEALFDSILYIDVLEHIRDDRAELERASRHLSPGGRLVVLSPAHGFLYSPFDRTIGHYRRYTRTSFAGFNLPECTLVRAAYLDSIGLFPSLANRVFLRQDLPTQKQILFWDRRLVPFSKWLDRLTGYHFGRSILFIWERSV